MFPDPFFLLEGEAAADPLPGPGIAAGGVKFGAAENRADIGLGGGEIDGLEELSGFKSRGLGSPAAGPGDAGVVFGQTKDLGAIGPFLFPAADGAGEIPGADLEVGAGIEKIGLPKGADPMGPGPVLRRPSGHLHQAPLAGSADGPDLEITLPPDHGFHQGQGEGVLVGGLGHEGTHFLGPADLPQPGNPDDDKRGQNHGQGGQNAGTGQKHSERISTGRRRGSWGNLPGGQKGRRGKGWHFLNL